MRLARAFAVPALTAREVCRRQLARRARLAAHLISVTGSHFGAPRVGEQRPGGFLEYWSAVSVANITT